MNVALRACQNCQALVLIVILIIIKREECNMSWESEVIKPMYDKCNTLKEISTQVFMSYETNDLSHMKFNRKRLKHLVNEIVDDMDDVISILEVYNNNKMQPMQANIKGKDILVFDGK